MNDVMSRVVIGMDPHKRSVTIAVMTVDEEVLGGGPIVTWLPPAGFESRQTSQVFQSQAAVVEWCAQAVFSS